MFGISKVRERPRKTKQAFPDWGVRPAIGIEAGSASMPEAKNEECRLLLEQAAAALERMQSRCASLQAQLADQKRVREELSEEHRFQLLQRDQEFARLEDLAAEFRNIALAQRETIGRANAERAERDEQIARLEEVITRYQEAARSSPSAADQASPELPQEPELATCAGDTAEYGFGSLDDDGDVIRFRKHMEMMMAA